MLQDAITIRRSTEDDGRAVHRLAQLDGREAPAGDSLLAYVDGELRAAMPLEGRKARALADPFYLTGDVIELLRLRARQERKVAA